MLAENENAKYWADFWKSSVQKRGTVTDEEQAARWNEMADHFGRNMEGERREKRMEDLLAVLREAGFSPGGATVLDIGCGPGAISIPLARAGAKVTSLDIATGMLDRLRETALKEHLDIDARECSWWSADIDQLGFRKKFDLVIASSTPAVKDVETFDRMMACSKRFCYYNGFIGGNQNVDTTRRPLAEILGFEPRVGQAFGPGGRDRSGLGLIYPFMYLYTQGYFPIIRFNRHTRPEQDWAEAAGKAIERFGRHRELSPDQKETILNYYRDASVDGRYKPGPDNVSAMMVWTVH